MWQPNPGENKLYTVNGKKIKYHWPYFKTTFPIEKYSLYTKEMVDKCCRHTKKFCKICAKKFDKQGYRGTGMFVSLMYPRCIEPFRMEVLVKFIIYWFFIDDHVDNEWGDCRQKVEGAKHVLNQYSDSFDKILGEDVSMIDWEPYILGIYATNERIMSTWPRENQIRYANLFKVYIKGCMDELEYYDRKIARTVQEIKEIRIQTIGVNLVFELIQYAHGIIITNEERWDPLFNEIIDAGIEQIFYVNDLYSFRKEQEECNGDFLKCNNLIALYVKIDGLSLQDAVYKLHDNILKSEQRIWDLQKQYFEKHPDMPARIKYYWECFNRVIGGSWATHVCISRFTGVNHENGCKNIRGTFTYNKYSTDVKYDGEVDDYSDFFRLE